jgi:maltose-binding protein MalE
MIQHWKKWISLGFLFLLVWTSGCKARTTPPPATPTPAGEMQTLPTATLTPTPNVINGTVSIWHSWDEVQRSALFRRISAFQSLYPDVQFDVMYVPPLDLQAYFEEAMSQGAGPSILIAPAEWAPKLLNQGYLLDLTDRVEGDLVQSLNPAGAEEGVYNGRRVGLPLILKGVVLYRNKTIISMPPKTFDELVALATTATEAGTVGADLERSFYYSGGHLYGLGGILISADGTPAFQLDDFRIAQEWLFLLREFEKAGMTEYNSDNDLRLFKENRVGMIIDGSWNMYTLAGEIGPLNLVIDPWPAYKNGRLSGFVQAENMFLTSRAANEEDDVSWLFMRSFYTPEAQLTLADVGLIPAINVKLVQSSPDTLKVADPFVAQAMLALDGGAAYPIAPEMNVYLTQMDVTLQSYLSQGVNSKVALQRAYDAILSILSTRLTIPTATP